jgi:hypothetical protein
MRAIFFMGFLGCEVGVILGYWLTREAGPSARASSKESIPQGLKPGSFAGL